MKKIYAVILLGTYLLGVVQPIRPMIEYQLQEGDIANLMTDETLSHDKRVKKINSPATADHSPDHEPQSLLDTDYYPLAPQPATASSFKTSIPSSVFFLRTKIEFANPTYLPNPPPPKIR